MLDNSVGKDIMLMRKLEPKSLLLLMILVVFALISCSIGGSRTEMINNSNIEKDMEARLEKIVEAINRKDKEALEAVFSKKSRSDSNDIVESINSLFDFIQGTINTRERASGSTVFESNDYGHQIIEVSSYYFVNTDIQKYFFLLRDYPVDTDNPDNVGVYTLLVVRADEEEKIWDGDNKIIYDGDTKLSHAGIYLPLK